MPRKVLAPARAALRFAQEAIGECGAARNRRGMGPRAAAGGQCFSAARAALALHYTAKKLGSMRRAGPNTIRLHIATTAHGLVAQNRTRRPAAPGVLGC